MTQQVKDGEFPFEDALQKLFETALTNEETISASAATLQATTEKL